MDHTVLETAATASRQAALSTHTSNCHVINAVLECPATHTVDACVAVDYRTTSMAW